MKIAQIAPVVERVPPKKYGGTERVVHALTEELVRRGHNVTLFASGDSITSAKLESVAPVSLRELDPYMYGMYGGNQWTLLNIARVYERQNEFDIIHDHTGHIGLPLAQLSRTPVVTTMHGAFLEEENMKIFQSLNKPHVVTISKAQQSIVGPRFIETVYNGLPMEDYPFSDTHDNYLLFVGRFTMFKGAHHAIHTALRTGYPLILAAKLEESERPYFDKYIKPYLSRRIHWIGEVDTDQRNRLMSKAKAFLHPITWNEPFGLVMIEAMACGCPVVAFNRGSAPEVVQHKRTGYVVKDFTSMLDAIPKVDRISRAACRAHALQNFSARVMTDNYEKIYSNILAGKYNNIHGQKQTATYVESWIPNDTGIGNE